MICDVTMRAWETDVCGHCMVLAFLEGTRGWGVVEGKSAGEGEGENAGGVQGEGAGESAGASEREGGPASSGWLTAMQA
jgi:hypothetical protein